MTTRGREVIRGKLWIPKGRSGKVCRVSYWFCCVDVVLLCETLQPLMCAASERTFANMFSRKESIRLSAILSFSSPRCMNFFDSLRFFRFICLFCVRVFSVHLRYCWISARWCKQHVWRPGLSDRSAWPIRSVAITVPRYYARDWMPLSGVRTWSQHAMCWPAINDSFTCVHIVYSFTCTWKSLASYIITESIVCVAL